MVEKCKREWLLQRQKVQAVELLQEKKLKGLAMIENKKEQKMFDEIATQQFVRRNR
jgi:flagellar FliJ protein